MTGNNLNLEFECIKKFGSEGHSRKNKQIQRIYVPRHFIFAIEYMSYHATT